ncbi:cyclin [Ancistrocladus abbreviatus]
MVARREAVEWMMKVNAHYGFSAIALVLAVNYFDRFNLSIKFQGNGAWMFQLAAVACLSLASKIAESQIPPLDKDPFAMARSISISTVTGVSA